MYFFNFATTLMEMEGRQNILKDFIGMERLFNGTLYNPEN